MDHPDPPSPNPDRPLIIGLGEALVDRLPDGEVIGGAPLNVALQASQLGNAAAVVSRVGHDTRGERIVQTLRGLGVDTRGVQVDPNRPTGTVDVRFDEHAEPRYTIVGDVAWDHYHYDPTAASLAMSADAICFGSLAQRSPAARSGIGEFARAAHQAVVLFDVNLRQEFFDRTVIESGMHLATAVKCNLSELAIVTELLELGVNPSDAAVCLIDRFSLDWLAVTRGERGTAVVSATQRHESEPVVADTASGDPVGAGDSVSAALLHGAVRGWPWEVTLSLANHIGAYIASQRGACPPLPDELILLATAPTGAGERQ